MASAGTRAIDTIGERGAAEFLPRFSAWALAASNQLIDRWAPEQQATTRFRGLRALEIVDRRLMPYIQRAEDSPRRVSLWEGIQLTPYEQPARARSVAQPSWVFPVPWFGDEIKWARAARAATAMMPEWVAGDPVPAIGMPPVAAPPVVAGESPAMPAAASELGAARPWSPLLSFRAAQAAELMAGVMAQVRSMPGVTAPVFAYVAPTDLDAGPREGRAAATPIEVEARREQLAAAVARQVEARQAELERDQAELAAQAEAARRQAEAVAREAAAQRDADAAARVDAQARQAALLGTVIEPAPEIEPAATPAAARADDEPPVAPAVGDELAAARADDVEPAPGPIVADEPVRSAEDQRGERTADPARAAQAAPAVSPDRAAGAGAATVESTRPGETHAPAIAPARPEVAAPPVSAGEPARPQPVPIAAHEEAAPTGEGIARRAPARVLVSELEPRAARPDSGDDAAVIDVEPAAIASAPAGPSQGDAVELLTASALHDPDRIAPISGPRVALPSGLSGLLYGVRAARAAASPLRATAQPEPAPGPTDAAARARTALTTLAAALPAPLAHVAWSDRWLARFAGATAPALATYAMLSRRDPSMASERLFVAPAEVAPRYRQPIEAWNRELVAPVAPGGVAATERGSAFAMRADAALAPAGETIAWSADDVGPQASTLAPQAPAEAAVRSGTEIRDPESGPEARDPRLEPEAREPEARDPRPEARDPRPEARPAAPPARTAAAAAPLAPEDASSPARAAAPLLDDDTPVSEQMFAAIASALADHRAAEKIARGQAPRVARASEPALSPSTVVSPVDRLIARGAVAATGAGLSASLSSSPFAAALASVLGLSPTPAFDPRALALSSPVLRAVADAPAAHQGWLARLWFAADPAAAPPATTGAVWTRLATSARPLITSWSGPPATAAASAATAAAPRAGTSTDLLGDEGAAADPTAPESIAAYTRTPPASPRRDLASTLRPGSLGQAAERWSVARQLAASGLSLDFLQPEALAAAQVYGFGPAEVMQATRLATAGAANLSALAAAFDYTFVEAMHAERPVAGLGLQASGVGLDASEPDVVDTPPADRAASADRAAPEGATPAGSPSMRELITFLSSQSRRLPHGAFLWPQAALDGLGIRGSDADAGQPHVRAALDLLAAGQVAAASSSSHLPVEFSAASPTAKESSIAPAFQAIYLALSRDPDTQSLPPTVRAARALALARQATEGSPMSARARAAAAWAVLPRVFTTTPPTAPGRAASARGGADPARPSARMPALDLFGIPIPPGAPGAPGAAERTDPMLRMASRAGESLGSLIAPTSPPRDGVPEGFAAGESYTRPSPTPLVQTGPAAPAAGKPAPASPGAGSGGGGRSEMPAWFSRAAQSILSGPSDRGMSVAEMVLVSTGPKRQMAASQVGSRAQSAGPSAVQSGAPTVTMPNIERMAEDLFLEICRLLEAARERNGDPWQS